MSSAKVVRTSPRSFCHCLTRPEALEAIVGSAQRTDQKTNAWFGLVGQASRSGGVAPVGPKGVP